MSNDVPGLFLEAQGLVAALRGVSEARKLVDLLVPQDQSSTLVVLRKHYRYNPPKSNRNNDALVLLTRYVRELCAMVNQCQLDKNVSLIGMELAGIFLASTLPRDGGHAV
jgi:hypothetical protein